MCISFTLRIADAKTCVTRPLATRSPCRAKIHTEHRSTGLADSIESPTLMHDYNNTSITISTVSDSIIA